jgi:DNA invertase Pin-like site-specific DNA recombinase
VAAAAPILKQLTGPINVKQGPKTGRRGASWVAEFTPNLVPALATLAASRGSPTRITLEYLNNRTWITTAKVEVTIEEVPTYEEIAPTVVEMTERGASVLTIARALAVCCDTVKDALKFARTGRRPHMRRSGKRHRKRHGPAKYIAIGPDVVRMHEIEQQSFAKIARFFGVNGGTAVRAYDYLRRQAVHEAAERGERPKRGRYSHLGPEVKQRIRAGFTANERPADVAKAAGCGVSTVYRVYAEMRSSA